MTAMIRNSPRVRIAMLLAALCVLGSACLASNAWASDEKVASFDVGTEYGGGAAVDDATGELYVAEGLASDVSRFASDGTFLGEWGWNTVQTGPDKAGVDAIEKLTIKATSGTFKLRYAPGTVSPSETGQLPYNATATEVETAVNQLSDIVAVEGHVKVEGGPGDAAGSAPYHLTFEAGTGDEEQALLVPETAGLAGEAPFEEERQGAPAFEDCSVTNGDVCRRGRGTVTFGEGAGEFISPVGVAVDQATGDVYVLDYDRGRQNGGVVQIFSSGGHTLLGSFGEKTGERLGALGEPEFEPAKLRTPTSIAVDSAGDVFIGDRGYIPLSGTEGRVAVFKPVVAGKYEAYVFVESAARQCELTRCVVNAVAVDAAGNLYLDSRERVFEYAPGEPRGLICESEPFLLPQGLAVFPASEEAVAYGRGANKFYIFDPCAGGKLAENTEKTFDGVTEGIKHEGETAALAVNPSLVFSVGRAPGVVYAVSLIEKEPSSTELAGGYIFAPPQRIPPKVESVQVSDVGATYATITAKINTGGNPTHWTIQYSRESTEGCATEHTCSEAPVGGATLAAQGEAVSATISGLQPFTIYHFRIVGSSHCNASAPAEGCAIEGENDRELSTFALETGLPDQRAYEEVSPALKLGGGEVRPPSPDAVNCSTCLPGPGTKRSAMQAAPDGNAVAYEGGPFSVTGESVGGNDYLATRTERGWGTVDENPAPFAYGTQSRYQAFTQDLSRGILFDERGGPSACPGAPEGYANLYLLGGVCEGHAGLQPLLGAVTSHHRSAAEFELQFADGSADLSHIVFQANDALTGATAFAPPAEDAGPNSENIYEWHEGNLALVNVLPGNSAAPPHAVVGSQLLSIALNGGTTDTDFLNTVSRDGSRIFWTDTETQQLYVREGATVTKEIHDKGQFLTASADGSQVLLNDGHLYSLEAEAVDADLTAGQGGFVGILGASEDMSRIYFVDTNELTSEDNPRGAHAISGQPNLYYWSDGALRFIGTLAAFDGQEEAAAFGFGAGDWAAPANDRSARVTANGGYLAFMSVANLTGYDNERVSGPCYVVSSPDRRCDEVYEYDAENNKLTCASCNQSGANPIGPSTLTVFLPSSDALQPPTDLSENGRIFFSSSDDLSPQIQNPKAGVANVAEGVQRIYEYEPDGLGSCTREPGCVSLISSGSDETDSAFVTANPSGSDVFFATRSQLAPADRDDLMDLYDAREPHAPGEQVAFPPEVAPIECAGEECRQPPSTGSGGLFGAMPTSVLTGAGNLTPTAPPPASPAAAQRPAVKASKLVRALAACHRDRGRPKRKRCETKARRTYAAAHKAAKPTAKGRSTASGAA